MTRRRLQPPPDWAVDALFEIEDPLPGCYQKLIEPAPAEVSAKRPRRGRPKRKHNQPT